MKTAKQIVDAGWGQVASGIVAAVLGVARTTLHRWARHHKLGPCGPRGRPKHKITATSLRMAGWPEASRREIARNLGVHPITVKRAIERLKP
jgi:hypothetical protein